MRHTGTMSPAQLPPRQRSPRVRNALLVGAALAIVGLGLAGPVGAQEPVPAPCAGVLVDADVAAASVPGGRWTVEDSCVPLDAVYEAELLGYRLVGGLGVATYTDGHVGRVAFLTARVAEDRSLTLVGVEDAATGAVTWAYADGSYSQVGATRTVGGAADASTVPMGAAPGAVEPAQLQLTLDGTGTDLATAQGPVADQLRTLLDQAAVALGG